jgi:NAD(P)H-hydrate epimerase
MVLGIGPGLGTHQETSEFAELSKNILRHWFWMDALNIISKNPSSLQLIPENSIITPHPKNSKDFFGKTKNSFERSDLVVKKLLNLRFTLY